MILLLILLVSGHEVVAQNQSKSLTPKYSNEYMNIGVGARQFGMGFTAVSISEDVTSGYWNPAGLLRVKNQYEAAFMHSSYFGGLANYDYLGFVTSIDDSSKLAISAIRFAVDDIPDTRFLVDVNGAINYDKIAFFSSADYGFLVSYARKLPILGGLDFGANVKVVHRMVGKFSKAWGFGIDVGVQKQIKNWKIGVMAKDLSGTFSSWSHNLENIEEIYKATGNAVPLNSTEVTLPRLIFGGARKFNLPKKFFILVAADFETTFDGKRNTLVKSNFASIDPRVGLEISYNQLAFLRFGINQFQQIKSFDGKKEWTMQPNFGVGVAFKRITLDYSLTDIGNLAPGLFSHVFSLKVNFTKNKDE